MYVQQGARLINPLQQFEHDNNDLFTDYSLLTLSDYYSSVIELFVIIQQFCGYKLLSTKEKVSK